MSVLRDLLIQAKIAGRKIDSHREGRGPAGYYFRTNEDAADAAIDVVARHFRQLARLHSDPVVKQVIDELVDGILEEDKRDYVLVPSDEPMVTDPSCAARWWSCTLGEYDPRCCRFPKSCSPLISQSELEERVRLWNSRVDSHIPLG